MKNKLSFILKFALCLGLLIIATCFYASAETDGIFTYDINNGKIEITEIDFSGQNEITIPEYIAGYPVTTIQEYVMEDKTYIFGDDTVDSIYIPKTVETIRYTAFSYADLRKIIVDPYNNYYSSDENGVLYNKDKTTLFKIAPCYSETTFTVPTGVRNIGNEALQACQYITEIDMPDELDSIGEQAFYGLESLISLDIPEGITSIPQNTVAANPALVSVNLPDSLRTIYGSAFTECYSLKQVIIPEGVTTIALYAFESDTSLERIVLPSSLQSVGQAICGNCPSLGHVYYTGSQSEWEALNVATGPYYGNRTDAFSTAEFHYNFNAAPYKTLNFDCDGDILILTGEGTVPAGGENNFQFWDEYKDTVSAAFISGEINSISEGAFNGFDQLKYVIADTDETSIAHRAFIDCTSLETMMFFGNASAETDSFQTDAEYIQFYLPANANISGNYDSDFIHIIPFSFGNNTLTLNGSVTWDGYQFLDTMAAFCMHFSPIEKINCPDFTFNALPLYGTNNNGEYERIGDNRLINAELSAKTGSDEAINFNDLVSGLSDGSIRNFKIVVKDKNHEEINDTPVTTKDEESGIIGTIKKALRWIVTLMNKLFAIISKIGK